MNIVEHGLLYKSSFSFFSIPSPFQNVLLIPLQEKEDTGHLWNYLSKIISFNKLMVNILPVFMISIYIKLGKQMK